MKKLAVLCAVVLFVLLPVVPVVGCQQQPAVTPTPTTSLTLSPSPVPSPPPTTPTASPSPTPEATPEVKELLIFNLKGWTSGSSYWVEGTVKNVGTVPLQGVQLEVEFYDKDGELVTTASGPTEPATIEVWKTAHCKAEAVGKAELIRRFHYRFVLPSGEQVPARSE
ncbi:FxLYD domain-containing protein [Chloroflexota bacterium]